jgi:hypothetical protein
MLMSEKEINEHIEFLNLKNICWIGSASPILDGESI